jgi:signal transduction histidine kinase
MGGSIAGTTAEPGPTSAPILLVDDRPANLLALAAVLEGPEHELVSAQSGREALALLAAREFAVVLLDLQMPVMDGVETAIAIRRIGDARGRLVPVIFLTAGEAAMAGVLGAYATGAADFLQKPLDPDILRAKVHVFVALYRTQQRLIAEVEERRRLQDALAARDRMLSIVSHDLRNPLNTILLGVQHIAVAGGRAAGAVVRAAGRMSRLVDDMLDLTALDAGSPLSMKLGCHDLRELAREVLEELDSSAQARSLALHVEMSEGLLVVCDPERIQQVLANLVGNAIKFSREGRAVDILASRTDDEVVVSVRDEGVGIPPQQLPQIFDRYWKGDSTRRDGVGLGLSIAREIVAAHGGRMWVDSAEGRGSTFSFALRSALGGPTAELEKVS